MGKEKSIIRLTGKLDNYLLDPNNRDCVLKTNGELSSSQIGYKVSDGSKVIIKRIHPRLMGNQDAIKRFAREASFQVIHPGIECIRELIYQDNNIFLVRDYIEGIDLKSLLNGKWRKLITTRFVVNCTIKTLEALEELHKNNIIHCDIKPSNIVLLNALENSPDFSNPGIKLIDFGLAQNYLELRNDRKTKLPFSFIYAPPEQVLGFHELINPTCDIYSLGVTMYELLCMKTPFHNENPMITLQLQIAGKLTKNRRIDDKLFDIIAKATSKPALTRPPNSYSKRELNKLLKEAQNKRYQTASDFRQDLTDFLI